jgi:predicted dehydrogenase
VLLLKGSSPVRVEAAGTPVFSAHEDIATARLEFADGCLANLTASRVTPDKMRKIRLFCRDSYIAVDCLEQNVAVFRLKDTGAAPTGDWLSRLAVDRAQLTREEPLKMEIESFVRAVTTGGEPEVTGTMAREAMETAFRIMDDLDGRMRRFQSR